jgi:hypothetical protein
MERTSIPQEKVSHPQKIYAFFSPAIQKKLSVGSANDSYEVEADHIADKVIKMSEPSPQVTHTGTLVQRKCAACEQEEKLQMKPLAESITPLIQRSSSESGGVAPSHVENQINSSRGGGSVMDHGTKTFMESRFETDFSNVKIHTGSEAVQMSRELNAQAFAVGNDIYFNEGKYNPNSDSGKHLLAHELTHTVQQSGGVGRKVQKQEDDPCTYRTANVKDREIHLNLNLHSVRIYQRDGRSFSVLHQYNNLITGPSTSGLARNNDWCHLYSIKGFQRLSGHGLINFVNYCDDFGFHSNYWRHGDPRPSTPTLIPGAQSAGCARIPDSDENSTASSQSNEFYNSVQLGDCVRIYSRPFWRDPTFSNCHGSDNCSAS